HGLRAPYRAGAGSAQRRTEGRGAARGDRGADRCPAALSALDARLRQGVDRLTPSNPAAPAITTDHDRKELRALDDAVAFCGEREPLRVARQEASDAITVDPLGARITSASFNGREARHRQVPGTDCARGAIDARDPTMPGLGSRACPCASALPRARGAGF